LRINLNVPYAEKDLAKQRGAKWDSARKTWYVENNLNEEHNLRMFLQWAPERLKLPTKSEPLTPPPFKVRQPRTPTNKERKKYKLKKNDMIYRNI